MRALAVTAAVAATACAPKGYFLDEESGRIDARDRWGKVTRSYDSDSPEYRAIARRFWPELVVGGAPPEPGPPRERKRRLGDLMRSLDKDQWHILLDLDLWTGDDKEDLARLEDIEAMAKAVKRLKFKEYLDLKESLHTRQSLKERLLKGYDPKEY